MNAILNQLQSNPKKVRNDLEQYLSEQSLLSFIRHGWHTLEPAVPLVENYAMHAICDHLEAVQRGQIKRLLLLVPPGTTKSMSSSVFFPAWLWGPKNEPSNRIISCAHEKSLATRDNVRCRDLIQSEWYQEKWGNCFEWKSDQNAKEYYENDKTGWRRANSAEGLTGKRGDIVLIDDPHSVEGAESDTKRETVCRTFAETIPTRLNIPEKSAIIVIMQRVHQKDVASLAIELGYEVLMLPMRFEADRRCYSTVKPSYIQNPKKVRTRYNKTKKVWIPVSQIPTEPIKDQRSDEFGEEEQFRYNVDWRKRDGELLDPKRFPDHVVADLEKALSIHGGSYAVSAQLQLRPAPRGGGMFQEKDFKYLDNANGLHGRIVRGWDLAASGGKKSPYTVGVKMMLTTDKRVIILDVTRFKKTPGAMEDAIEATCERDSKRVTQSIPQDPGQAGKAQVAAFVKRLHGFNVRSSPESGSKENRAIPLSAQAEGGNVYLIRASWNDEFINEATVFPNSEFKDQIDAASRAYTHLLLTGAGVIAMAPVVVTRTS